MKNEHTPGPWKWHVADGWWKSQYEGSMPYLESSNGVLVCAYGTRHNGVTDEGDPPNKFDRRLIAAAPDMLEALQMIVMVGPTPPMLAIERAKIAIDKATGK